jgi:hypothetical protein
VLAYSAGLVVVFRNDMSGGDRSFSFLYLCLEFLKREKFSVVGCVNPEVCPILPYGSEGRARSIHPMRRCPIGLDQTIRDPQNRARQNLVASGCGFADSLPLFAAPCKANPLDIFSLLGFNGVATQFVISRSVVQSHSPAPVKSTALCCVRLEEEDQKSLNRKIHPEF